MNILVLTSVYKDDSLGNADKSTNVVNSFVHDWTKQGHRVVVIHNAHRYPAFVHKLPKGIKQKLASGMGFQIADYSAVCQRQYSDQGAEIYRFPMIKMVPHRAPGKREVQRQVGKIIRTLQEVSFKPDIIIGHWASPQMEIIYELKKQYTCRTAVVLHGMTYINQPGFPAAKYLEHIDRLGCRSRSHAEEVQELLKLEQMPFICYSGVPDAYLDQFQLNTEKHNHIEKWKFVYVGRLVQYKNIDTVIKALSGLTEDWQFDVIGEGGEKDNLIRLCEQLGCADKVVFHGKVSRDEVMDYMSNSHCFVMVSKGEVFGLVYLEAMAASCITVGSVKEGIDGVIRNEENGFLCEPGDEKALMDTIKKIVGMSESERIAIVREGYRTAREFSDSAVAKAYLEKVMN